VQTIKQASYRILALGGIVRAMASRGNYSEAERSLQEIRSLLANDNTLLQAELARVTAALVAELAQAEHYERAEQLMSEIAYFPFDTSYSIARATIAGSLVKSGNPIRAKQMFNEAEQYALSIQHKGNQWYALSCLSKMLAESTYFDQAARVARLIPIGSQAQLAIASLATIAARHGDYDNAEQLLGEAKRMMRPFLQSDQQHTRTLCIVGVNAALAGDTVIAEKIFNEADRVARTIQDHDSRDHALVELAIALARTGHYDRAEQVIQIIKDHNNRDHTLVELVIALARTGHYDKAEQVIQTIQDCPRKVFALAFLGGKLAHAGDHTGAARLFSATAQSINAPNHDFSHHELTDLRGPLKHYVVYGFSRYSALAFLGAELAHAGDPKSAKFVFEVVERDAHKIPDDFRLAPVVGDLKSLLKPSALYRFSPHAVFTLLAGELTRAGDEVGAKRLFEEAERFAETISDRGRKGFAIAVLAGELTRAGDEVGAKRLFEEAEEVAYAIPDETERESVLCDLATLLARSSYLDKAAQIARMIRGDGWATDTILAQAGQLFWAFQKLTALTSDDFVDFLDEIYTGLQNIGLNSAYSLYRQLLIKSLKIMAWLQPEWDNIVMLMKDSN
jgi:tetratricopeptide (TPR) repeat protein